MAAQTGQSGPKIDVTLTSTEYVVPMTGRNYPCTLALMSTDASRNIQLSLTSSSTGWFTPTFDYSDTYNLGVRVLSPVLFAKFVGASGNTGRILA